MAPEQLNDPNRVDHRADIYSLGVVFYELLTGELPQGRFPLPSEKTPVGADIDGIVLKALHKERDKRQQSAGEMKTEIETAGMVHNVTKRFHLSRSLVVLIVSVLAMYFGLALIVPGKLYLIPFELKAGYVQADIRLIRLVVDADEAALKTLQKVASQDDPRLVARMAKKKIDDIILAEMETKLVQNLDKLNTAKSKQVAWPSILGIASILFGFLLALLALLFSLKSLNRMRFSEEKKHFYIEGCVACLSLPFILSGLLALKFIFANDHHNLTPYLTLTAFFAGIIPIIRFILRATRQSNSNNPHRNRVLFAFLCICVSIASLGTMIALTWIYESLRDVPPLPVVKNTFQDQVTALNAEFAICQSQYEEKHKTEDFSSQLAEWKKEFEQQKKAVLAAAEKEYGNFFGSEHERIMWNTRVKFALKEMNLRDSFLFLITMPLFSLAVPGTVLGNSYLYRMRREKGCFGWKRAIFAGLFWPCVFIVIAISSLICVIIWESNDIIQLLVLFLILMFLPCVTGWRHLNRIRKTSEKPGWLVGMIAALVCPCFIIWFYPWIFGVQMGVDIGRDFNFSDGTSQFLGGLVAFVFSATIIGLIVWRTYRWIFPAKPSPTQLVWRSLIALVCGGGALLLGMLLVDVDSAFHHYLHDQKAKTEAKFDKEIAEFEKAANQNSTWAWLQQKEKRGAWTAQINLQQHLAAKENEIKRIENRNHAYDMVYGFLLISSWGTAFVSLIVAVICSWMHLLKIRCDETKPGLITAFVIALPIPASALIAAPALLASLPFLASVWGEHDSTIRAVQTIIIPVMFLLGAVAGIVLLVYVSRKFFFWYFRASQ